MDDVEEVVFASEEMDVEVGLADAEIEVEVLFTADNALDADE